MKQITRKALAVILTLAMLCSLMVAAPLTASAETPENLALNAVATADSTEADSFAASKANDGNASGSSRWASAVADAPHWLQLEFEEPVTVASFNIIWERANVYEYKFQYLTEVAPQPTDPTDPSDPDEPAGILGDANNDTVVDSTDATLVLQTYGGLAVTGTFIENLANVDNDPAINATDATLILQKYGNLIQQFPRTDFGTVADETTNEDAGSADDAAAATEEWVDAYSFSTTTPSSTDHKVNLDASVTAKKFRILITSFTPTAADTTGSVVEWNTVSIFEVYLYGSAIELPSGESVSEVAASLEIPEVADSDTTLTLPEVPEGMTVSINGADYEQILDNEGNIHRPLNDVTLKVSFTVSNGTETVVSADYDVPVSGIFTATETSNAKPAVIPELAEWAGADGGDFTLGETPKLIVTSAQGSKVLEGFENAKQEIISDFKEITGKDLTVSYGSASDAAAGDIVANIGGDDYAYLGDEGYKMSIDDVLTVDAPTSTGFYWSTRSILQILKQTGGTIAKGTAVDYPRYSVRGFMLDVGRTPVSLETLQSIVKNMSWYKLNDFGVHLFDNYIWVEQYQNTDDPYGAYSAFRLESDIKEGGNNGKNMADLTATDLYYTKDEFRSLIQDSRALGVNIVPEFDTPAHSLALTKVRPDLHMTTGNRWVDHFDLSNPESLEFITSLWNEYITGDDPVFDEDTILNFGTDEYEGSSEDFRQFTNDMIEFVNGTGRTARLWGSLTSKSGSTVVEPGDSQMYVWNTGWANPNEMYQQGFSLINILDGGNYIVPAAGYYADYIDAQGKYNSYDPCNFGGTMIPSGDDQMLGGSYAIWNDMVDKKINGISDYDIFDRFFSPIVGYSSKLWGDASDMSYSDVRKVANKVGTAPGTNPYYEVESETGDKVEYDFAETTITDKTGNGYDAVNTVNASVVNEQGKNALKLNGGASYVETPIDHFGAETELSFSVYRTSDSTEEQILFETSDKFETYSIKAVQKDTGKVGFSREKMDYSFDYTLPVGEWVDLKIVGHKDTADLYVNGELVSTVGTTATGEGNIHATLMIPFTRIGSETNAFTGLIANLKVYQKVIEYFDPNDPTIIDRSAFTVTCDNENATASVSGGGSEGPATLAFDGDENTHWHSNYSPVTALPANIIVDMQQAYTINKFSYTPRQIGGNNGKISSFTLSYKLNEGDEWTTIIDNGTFLVSADAQSVRFDAVEARYLKITVNEGSGGFGSAAEFYVHQAV